MCGVDRSSSSKTYLARQILQAPQIPITLKSWRVSWKRAPRGSLQENLTIQAIAEFWREVETSGTPVIERIEGEPEGRWVTFLWRGDEETNVVVYGLGSWADFDENAMTRLVDTDVWYRTYRRRSDFRSSYQLSPNDSLEPWTGDAEALLQQVMNLRVDPLNKEPWGQGRSSFALEEAPAQPWIFFRAAVAKGSRQPEGGVCPTF